MKTLFLARAAGVAGALSLIAAVQTAHAESLTLQNDGFVDGDSIGLQSGFVQGEAAGVTLGPIDGPYTVEKVQLIFGPASGSRDVTLRVYLDDGNDAPGTMLFEGDYEIESADDAIIELDLSGESVQVASGSIRVALVFQHDGLPSVARDDDGSIQNGRNWIFTGGQWTDSSIFGLEGDWIIRAQIETDANPATASSGSGSTSSDASSAASGDPTSTGVTSSSTGAGPGATGPGATGGGTCTPGSTQACFGPGACQGGQSCLADGSGWDTCTCGADGSGGSSGDAGTDGGSDDGCGCAVPGAGSAGGAAIGLAVAALAVAGARRRRRR